jgi:glycogen debranching enzyme
MGVVPELESQAESQLSAAVMVPAVVTLATPTRRTLKQGESFALLDTFGDIVEEPLSPTGLFHHDTRYLSRLTLSLEGHRPLLLGSTVRPDNLVLDVDLTNPDLFAGDAIVLSKDTFHLARTAFLWDAVFHQHLMITSYAQEPRRLRLAFGFAADFADLFEIRGFRRRQRCGFRIEQSAPDQVAFVYESQDGVARATRIRFSAVPVRLGPQLAEFEVDLEPNQRRSIDVAVQCDYGNQPREAAGRFGPMLRRARRARSTAIRRTACIDTSNETVNAVLSRSASDLAMLLTDTPHGGYPYAGVPWFSTVFGRDGIISAMQMLWLNPEVARGVLRFLAAHQGSRINPAADEEPGKILHELRQCELARLGEVPFGRYFGSIDSTPLFVALAGMYWRRTHDRDTIASIWPQVKAALEWMDHCGDRDGDGFIEYQRMRETGLRNQGWKDSEDAVFHADGQLAEGSIALCEVQGYAYLARTVAAEIALDLGEVELSRDLLGRAEALRAAFDAAYWCDALDTYAVALDGRKQPCRVRTSNAAQLLFSGIARPDRARRMVRALFEPGFFTGWGMRTVRAGEPRFNPTSYHNGSVWPHDNALIALGLSDYGYVAETGRVASALFDAAAHMPLHRLPELYCGFARKTGKAPVLYPVACAPQAWAACTPFALLQACLGMQIDARSPSVVLRRPRLPRFLEWLNIRRLQIGSATVDLGLRRQGDTVAVTLLEREGHAEVEVVL